ncbi:MAG: glycoside hydrolase domain-containing protein [Phycisphaerae bacterium]
MRAADVLSITVAAVITLSHQPARAARPQRPVIDAKPLATLVLADFRQKETVWPVKAEHPAVKVAADGAGGGLTVCFPRQEQIDSAAVLWQASGKDGNWSVYDYLRLNITNYGKSRTTFWVRLFDEACKTEAQCGRFGAGIDPGKVQQIAVPLEKFCLADKSGVLDLKKMAKVCLGFDRQQTPGELVIDGLTLIKTFDGPSPFYCFDFQDAGGAFYDFPQTVPVTPKTQYMKELGYGFAKTDGLAAARILGGGKFPIFGDGVGLPPQTPGAKFTFLVDVPSGKYEVQAVAQARTWDGIPCFDYSVEANGKKVVDAPLTEEVFYSGQGQYWGVDKFHDPTKTLWQQYGREYFRPHVFQAEVADGQLKLDFNGCAVYVLWLYPADKAEAGRARVEAFQGEQDWRVDTSVARLARAPQEKMAVLVKWAAETEKAGYVVFARDPLLRVYPGEIEPATHGQVKALSIFAAPGQYESTTFAVHPLKDLRHFAVEVSDLAGPSGAVIPKSAIKVDIVKYFPEKTGVIDYTLTPSYLFPYRPIDLYADFNRQYWLTVHVPADASAGTYSGKITVKPEGGQPADIALEATIYPFKLADSPKEHGFFNARAPNYQVVRLFPKRAEELSRQVIEAELQDMIAHGAGGTTLPNARLLAVDKDGGNLRLDWADAKLYSELLKKHGLDKCEHICGSDMGWLIRQGLKEGTPEFARAYKDLVAQTSAFWREHGIKAVFQVIDEPRETDLNDWNRNRVDTIRLCKLAREAASGMKTFVTPMGDTDVYGNHYTVMMPLMDVWATHCWPGSMRGIFLAGKEKIAELWFYNNGLDRFQWGYHLWKSPALADWEWVYAWEARGAPPLIEDAIGIGDYVVTWNKGILPKLTYEWAREGVDDMRYIATLEKAIAAPREKTPTEDAAKAAAEAKLFLESLRKAIPDYPETDLSTGAEAGAKYTEGGIKNYFDAWRRQVAQYIIAIRSGTPAVRVDEAWAPLPKKAAEAIKSAVCLMVDKPPAMNAKLDDPAWKDAPVQTDFISLATGEQSALRTEVRIVSDGKKIYFHFHCLEPKYGEMKAYATERDGEVWKDDGVEVFLDTRHDRRTYFQVIVNTLGTVQDADTSDVTWDGDVQTAVVKGKGFYDIEIAIGLDSMKAKAGPGITWGINLCRDRLPEPAENASWTHVGTSFHNPSKFGVLKFEQK